MVGEAPRTKLRCISLDAVSNGIGRSGILGSFSGNQVKVPGPYYSGENDQMFKDLSGLYIEFFTYLRGALSAQWALGGREGGFVFRNSGIEALMRLLGDIVNHLVVSAALQPLVVGPTEVMQQARYYLDPAVQFFEEASEDRAQEFRKMYGSGAAMKLWRALQTEVRHARPEFDPEGLEDYLKGLEQQVTSEAYSMVQDIETHLKTEVRKGLEDEHGHRWFRKGVPFDVQQRSSQIAIAKNAKLRDDEEDVEEWDCLHIVDYQKILTFSHDVWERRFAGTFTAPGTEGRSWKTQSSWIDLFNTIRNAAAHDYSVSETDYEYLTWLTSWLINGEEAGPAPSSLG